MNLAHQQIVTSSDDSYIQSRLTKLVSSLTACLLGATYVAALSADCVAELSS
jgi:hypothetical protein